MGCNEDPRKAARRLFGYKEEEGFAPTGLYTYEDENGAAVFHKARMDRVDTQKFIRPYHYNGEEYVVGKPQLNNEPLYRLPDLLKRPRDPVYVVEGEKCVDALYTVGLLATTSGSASSVSKVDWSPLQDREVVIWPDNDDAGVKYAADVLTAVSHARVIDVDKLGLPKKGDCVDWLEAHPDASCQDVWNLPLFHEEDSGPGPLLIDMHRVKPEKISWLWDQRIALGKVSLIAGDPGLGKSMVSLAMAAHVSTGKSWPVDGSICPVGDVVLLSAEDDPSDTIRPRLDAAGADVTRIKYFAAVRSEDGTRRGFSLEKDLVHLEQVLNDLVEPKLVIIDPVSAYLGGTDSHNNADVRALLAPLAELAARRKVAVVCVTHLNKSQGAEIMYRATGSLAFVAAARAVFAVTRDEDDQKRRLILPIKNNLGDDETGLAYSIAQNPVGAPYLLWETEPVTETAAEIFAKQPQRTEQENAAEWLSDLLGNGPMRVTQVKTEATEAGLAWRTVQRAKAMLGAEAKKESFGGGWRWHLPKSAKSPTPGNLASFDECGVLRETKSANSDALEPAENAEERQERQGCQTARSGVLGDSDEVVV